MNKEEVSETPSFSDQIDVQQNMLNEDNIENYITNTKSWWRTPHLVRLNFFIVLITLTSTNYGYDGSMLNGLQSLPIWLTKMGEPTGAVLGALSNGSTFGILICFLFGSYVSDKFGRKFTIYLGQCIAIIGAVLQGASTDYAFFLVSRIILGCGAGLATVASPTLISEIAYPTHRTVATASYNVCWYLGAVVAAWVTYGTRNIASQYCWRIPSYLQGLFPLVQILTIWMVPESPRFLVSKGRIDEAEAVLRKYHTDGSGSETDNAFINFEMKEIQSAIELEKLTSNSKYSDFIKTPSFRKRLFLILWTSVVMQLSGNGLVSYYLSKVLDSIGITSTSEQLEINGCLMIYNFVISGFCAAIAPQFKRKTIFVTSAAMMLFFYIIWTVLSAINQERDFKDKSLGKGVLAMIFFYYLSYNLGSNGLPYLYITEILPYSHRAKGISLFQFVQNLLIVYNGFVNSIAMDAIEWKYYIVYCCCLAVELTVVSLFFVETSGYTLEEVAKVFGDDSATTLHTLSSPVQKVSVNHAEDV